MAPTSLPVLSCSVYSIQALEKHKFWRAVGLIFVGWLGATFTKGVMTQYHDKSILGRWPPGMIWWGGMKFVECSYRWC